MLPLSVVIRRAAAHFFRQDSRKIGTNQVVPLFSCGDFPCLQSAPQPRKSLRGQSSGQHRHELSHSNRVVVDFRPLTVDVAYEGEFITHRIMVQDYGELEIAVLIDRTGGFKEIPVNIHD